MQSYLDHIVIGAASLGPASKALEDQFGSALAAGGKHPIMATHNRLMKLQSQTYLEVIAIDPDAPTPTRSRWFSLDEATTKSRLAVAPKPLCWVLAVQDITAATRLCGYDAGEIISMSRGDLSWKLTIPQTGALAQNGILPTLIEWPGGINPSGRLPDSEIVLEKLVLHHPDPDMIRDVLQRLGAPDLIKVDAGDPTISFHLATPNGPILIS